MTSARRDVAERAERLDRRLAGVRVYLCGAWTPDMKRKADEMRADAYREFGRGVEAGVRALLRSEGREPDALEAFDAGAMWAIERTGVAGRPTYDLVREAFENRFGTPSDSPEREDGDALAAFVERYIKTLTWSRFATEGEKGLVNGNLRTFAFEVSKWLAGRTESPPEGDGDVGRPERGA